MEKTILITIMICSLVALFGYSVIILRWYKKKTFEKATAAFGMIWAIVSVIITCIIAIVTIKESNLTVSIQNAHNEYLDEVYLEIDENDNIAMGTFPFLAWIISINNTGNKSVDKFRVQISFDNLVLYEQDNYQLRDHNRGISGYSTIVYESTDWIPPNQKVYIPVIDFSTAKVWDKNEDIYMNIYTITEDDKINKFKYKIILKDAEM